MTGFIEKMRKESKIEIGYEGFDESKGENPGNWQRKVSRNPEFPSRPMSVVAMDHLEKCLRASDLSVWQIVSSRDVLAFLHCAKAVVKKPIILEIDDWIFDLPSYNIASTPYEPGSDAEWVAYEQIKLSDAIICSTNYIKEKLVDLFPDKPIHVVRNAIDFDVWDNLSPIEPWFKFKEEGKIRIGYTGCGNHDEDIKTIKKPILKLVQEFPEVEFILPLPFESWKDSFGPQVLFNNQWVSIERFPHMIAGWGLDIGVAPLRDNSFNSAKSNLRYLEYAALKIPCVASPVIPFVESIKDGKNGFLASSQLDWYEKVKKLVLDEKLRKKIGLNAYEDVKHNFSMDKVGLGYASILRSLKHDFIGNISRMRTPAL